MTKLDLTALNQINRYQLLNGDWSPTGVWTFGNTGLRLLDTNASHDLIIAPGSDLTADRTLTLTTGDAARTITLSGNPTLGDWFNQSVKTTASPTFVGLNLSSTQLIDLSADVVGQRIQAVAGQTQPLWQLENSAGAVAIRVNANGDLFTDRWLLQNTNTFIGVAVVGAGNLAHTAGDQGYFNTFIGNRAGYNNTTGAYNVFIGYAAGQANTTGLGNFFGGVAAGVSNQGGSDNFFFGSSAGYRNVSGQANFFFGKNAGYNNTASYNMFLGFSAGLKNTTGINNLFVGLNAGYNNVSGNGSVYIGQQAGFSVTGGGNIFIGFNAGYRQTILSNQLIIDNQQRADAATELTNAILYGVMAAAPANQALRINAALTLPIMKTGATQAGAGAAAGELWTTASHATLPNNVVMRGV